jgi:hypothetical protein
VDEGYSLDDEYGVKEEEEEYTVAADSYGVEELYTLVLDKGVYVVGPSLTYVGVTLEYGDSLQYGYRGQCG